MLMPGVILFFIYLFILPLGVSEQRIVVLVYTIGWAGKWDTPPQLSPVQSNTYIGMGWSARARSEGGFTYMFRASAPAQGSRWCVGASMDMQDLGLHKDSNGEGRAHTNCMSWTGGQIAGKQAGERAGVLRSD